MKKTKFAAVAMLLIAMLSSCMSTSVKEIPYSGQAHGTFEEEWLSYSGTNGWWYATGFLYDEDDNMYSYQFTIAQNKMGILKPIVTQLALTDFTNDEHHLFNNVRMNKKGLYVNETRVQMEDFTSVQKFDNSMIINADTEEVSFNLNLDYGKGPVWHCDDGFLIMGNPETTTESTIYYSYTNMPTTGTIVIDGKVLNVSGKSWFDRQGGDYTIQDRATQWEWFSIRFDDNEELMLFTFPAVDAVDGTYIREDGSYSRLNNYSIEATSFTTATEQNLKFSSSWKLTMPGVKDEVYTIVPLMDGQVNIGYFEELCAVYNADDERVGYCFTELLPGARNETWETIH